MAALGRICSRSFRTFKVLQDSLAEPLRPKPVHSHEGQEVLWKKIFIFVCLPVLSLSFINVLMTEEPEPPEFKKYPHLRIRNRPFPWGDGQKTLFHNPRTNALPDGYEVQH